MIAAARGRIALGLLTLALLTACGLKGPLYLPDKPEEATPAAGTQQTPPKRRVAPRPAPQSQKEDAVSPTQSPPATPVDPSEPANPEPVAPPPER